MHGSDGPLQRPPIAGVGNAAIIQGQERVAAGLDGIGDIGHQRVEHVGALDQADRKGQGGVLLVLDLDMHLASTEQVVSVEAELQGVAQVDRHGDRIAVSSLRRPLQGGPGGQDPGGAGEVHGHRMNVDAGHGGPQPVERLDGFQAAFARRRSMKWVTASAMKVPEPHAGSSTCRSSGSVTTSRTIVRASQWGV